MTSVIIDDGALLCYHCSYCIILLVYIIVKLSCTPTYTLISCLFQIAKAEQLDFLTENRWLTHPVQEDFDSLDREKIKLHLEELAMLPHMAGSDR